jgi:hypothetical protein
MLVLPAVPDKDEGRATYTLTSLAKKLGIPYRRLLQAYWVRDGTPLKDVEDALRRHGIQWGDVVGIAAQRTPRERRSADAALSPAKADGCLSLSLMDVLSLCPPGISYSNVIDYITRAREYPDRIPGPGTRRGAVHAVVTKLGLDLRTMRIAPNTDDSGKSGETAPAPAGEGKSVFVNQHGIGDGTTPVYEPDTPLSGVPGYARLLRSVPTEVLLEETRRRLPGWRVTISSGWRGAGVGTL